MIVGLDFDNTIVSYEKAIARLIEAKDLMLDPISSTKNDLKRYFIESGNESGWTELQGELYGPFMRYAEPFVGALESMEDMLRSGNTLVVVSHRSRFPYMGEKYDLHDAARQWLKRWMGSKKDRLGRSLISEVYFLEEKDMKLQKIREIGCDIFLDDLVSILRDPDFPRETRRALFDPNGQSCEDGQYSRVGSWDEFAQLVKRVGRD